MRSLSYIGLIVERLNGQGAEGACSVILDDAAWVYTEATFDLLHELNQIGRGDQYVRLLLNVEILDLLILNRCLWLRRVQRVEDSLLE